MTWGEDSGRAGNASFQFRSPMFIHRGFRLIGRTKVLFDHHQDAAIILNREHYIPFIPPPHFLAPC